MRSVPSATQYIKGASSSLCVPVTGWLAVIRRARREPIYVPCLSRYLGQSSQMADGSCIARLAMRVVLRPRRHLSGRRALGRVIGCDALGRGSPTALPHRLDEDEGCPAPGRIRGRRGDDDVCPAGFGGEVPQAYC